MEIIGKSIPHLQSAFESVSAGIAESTKVKGLAAVNSAFDSFSSAQIGTFGALDSLPAVADVAQFPDPVAYFQTTKFAVPADLGFVPHEFVRILKDQRFNTAAELTRVAENNFINRLGDKIDKINYRIPSPSELTIPRPEPALLGRDNAVTSGATGAAYGPWFGRELKDQAAANNVTATAMEYIPPQPNPRDFQSPPEPEVLSERAIFDGQGKELKSDEKPRRGLEPAVGNSNGVSRDLIDQFTPDTGSASDADQRGIIIVGGKQDSLAQRGIIIVGGKTEGTYLETIDDTLAKLNQNPQPETVQLFQHQIGALQDMSSTINQSVQMNQQLSSSVFSGKIRI